MKFTCPCRDFVITPYCVLRYVEIHQIPASQKSRPIVGVLILVNNRHDRRAVGWKWVVNDLIGENGELHVTTLVPDER